MTKVAAAEPMPPLEVGDWFKYYGRIEEPLYPHNVAVKDGNLVFYGFPLAHVDEIRKANGTVWRKKPV